MGMLNIVSPPFYSFLPCALYYSSRNASPDSLVLWLLLGLGQSEAEAEAGDWRVGKKRSWDIHSPSFFPAWSQWTVFLFLN